MEKKKTHRVTLSIGGDVYTLKGEDGPERIREIARFFETRMAQIEKNYPQLTPSKAAVLTGLNLADDYLRLQEDYQQLLAMLKHNR